MRAAEHCFPLELLPRSAQEALLPLAAVLLGPGLRLRVRHAQTLRFLP